MKIANQLATILFLCTAFNPFVGFQHVLAVEEISSPTININPDVYYPMEEVLYLEGKAQPNSVVQIRFQKQGSKLLTFNAKSDSRGEWVLAEKAPLGAGDWEVRARTVNAKDQNKFSEWSNPRVFKVIISGITIGGVNVRFTVLSLIIIILLICGVILILYFNWRVRRLKTILLGKEIQEAKESVREGFSELRANQLNELRLMESRKKLSQGELAKKEHLIRDLEKMEHGMEDEIKDIEEKL